MTNKPPGHLGAVLKWVILAIIIMVLFILSTINSSLCMEQQIKQVGIMSEPFGTVVDGVLARLVDTSQSSTTIATGDKYTQGTHRFIPPVNIRSPTKDHMVNKLLT